MIEHRCHKETSTDWLFNIDHRYLTANPSLSSAVLDQSTFRHLVAAVSLPATCVQVDSECNCCRSRVPFCGTAGQWSLQLLLTMKGCYQNIWWCNSKWPQEVQWLLLIPLCVMSSTWVETTNIRSPSLIEHVYSILPNFKIKSKKSNKAITDHYD